MEIGTSSVEQWFSQNLIPLLIGVGILVALYAWSGRIVRAVVGRTLLATEGDFSGKGVEDAELQKRADTIESLVTTLLRVTVLAVGVLIVVGLLGLWSVLVLVGLFLAGLTIAGQSIVLDYLMGILIILEGQFFKGDNIDIGRLGWKGTVESVGLRRTVVRAVDGTVYSISNGELRLVANRTRVYAAAEVRVRGIRQGDLPRVLEVMAQVGREVASDAEYSAAVLEAPAPRFVDEADELGSIAVMRGRVVAGDRWRIATAVRVRLDTALTDAHIELNRRAIPQDVSPRRD